MSILLIGLCVLLTALHLGCSTSVSVARTENVELPQTQLEEDNTDALSDSNASTIYTRLLEILRNNYEFSTPTVDEINAGDLLVYRKETVTPADMGQIESNKEIPYGVLTNFLAINKSTVKLSDKFWAMAPTRPHSGPRDAQMFFTDARKRYPDIKVAVSFSKIGADLKNNVALVYVEYFNEKRGLSKMYFLMTLERYIPDTQKFRVVQVEILKVFPVQ